MNCWSVQGCILAPPPWLWLGMSRKGLAVDVILADTKKYWVIVWNPKKHWLYADWWQQDASFATWRRTYLFNVRNTFFQMFLFLTLLTLMITQRTDNNVHIAFLYPLSKFFCLLLFCLILVISCHSEIWASFIYSADFTQKSIWLWLSTAFNTALKQAVQCMHSRLFMSEMINKREVKMTLNGFSHRRYILTWVGN